VVRVGTKPKPKPKPKRPETAKPDAVVPPIVGGVPDAPPAGSTPRP
jgi:hypothetical protein